MVLRRIWDGIKLILLGFKTDLGRNKVDFARGCSCRQPLAEILDVSRHPESGDHNFIIFRLSKIIFPGCTLELIDVNVFACLQPLSTPYNPFPTIPAV